MYVKSDAPAIPGTNDRLEIIVAKTKSYENPEIYDSDDVY